VPLFAVLHEQYPDLTVRSVRVATSGQNNTVLIVNNALVFRFPRYPAGVAMMHRETTLLRAIRRYVPLPIPDPMYASDLHALAGRSFTGYPLLSGKPLGPSTFAALPVEVQHAIAAQLTAFLRALHAIPPTVLPQALPLADGRDQWAEMYARVRRLLSPHMRPDARDAVHDHFASFLDAPAHFTWRPVLRHGDFGPSNILYNPIGETVTGVIDFSEATRGDPAVDIAALAGYGPTFREALYAGYGDARAWEARIAFYVGTFALQEALSGLENGDAAAFRSGMASYV